MLLMVQVLLQVLTHVVQVVIAIVVLLKTVQVYVVDRQY